MGSDVHRDTMSRSAVCASSIRPCGNANTRTPAKSRSRESEYSSGRSWSKSPNGWRRRSESIALSHSLTREVTNSLSYRSRSSDTARRWLRTLVSVSSTTRRISGRRSKYSARNWSSTDRFLAINLSQKLGYDSAGRARICVDLPIVRLIRSLNGTLNFLSSMVSHPFDGKDLAGGAVEVRPAVEVVSVSGGLQDWLSTVSLHVQDCTAWHSTECRERRGRSICRPRRYAYGNPRVRLRMPGAFRIDAAGSTPSNIGTSLATPVIPAMT